MTWRLPTSTYPPFPPQHTHQVRPEKQAVAGLACGTMHHQTCRLEYVPPLRPRPDRATHPGQYGLQVTIVEDVSDDAKRDDRAAGRENGQGDGHQLVIEGYGHADEHAHPSGRRACG